MGHQIIIINNSKFADETKYAVYRKERKRPIGGGEMILIEKSIWFKDRPD